MKLTAALLAVVAAQDEDRWSFYDYSMPNDGRVGHAVSGVLGGHEGNRRFCHSTKDDKYIYRWDGTMNGYFAHYNPVECIGEELFCHIEERAHFGQTIGIRAGCAQMMNHPQVPTLAPVTLTPENKNHYIQEAARGATFQQGGNTAVTIFYGIGGCLALPAQNGELANHGDWRTVLENNYFLGTHGGYGQGQCLRFQASNAAAPLLPFGVSVCRACCLASPGIFTGGSDQNDGPCNFWPIGHSGSPTGMSASAFGCSLGNLGTCTWDGSSGNSNCEICTKEMFPNFSMFSQTNFDSVVNLFSVGTGAFCTSTTCTPQSVYSGSQPIAGGR